LNCERHRRHREDAGHRLARPERARSVTLMVTRDEMDGLMAELVTTDGPETGSGASPSGWRRTPPWYASATPQSSPDTTLTPVDDPASQLIARVKEPCAFWRWSLASRGESRLIPMSLRDGERSRRSRRAARLGSYDFISWFWVRCCGLRVGCCGLCPLESLRSSRWSCSCSSGRWGAGSSLLQARGRRLPGPNPSCHG
jgi:hypothetical protein